MSILIVEDNVISARMLEGILQHRDLEAVIAKNGRVALEVLQERTDIRLILLDLMMPEMDGFQFLEARARNAAMKIIPVIVLTALADTDTVRRVIGMGCKHYVVKPVREDTLMPKILEMMPPMESPDAAILRNRFDVMQAMGIDDAAYEEIFQAFLLQTGQIIEQLKQGGAYPSQALVAFLDDVPALCGPSVAKRLQIFVESSSARETTDYLGHIFSALNAANARRQRIRARMAAPE